MSEYKTITVCRDGDVATITLRRPERRNAINPLMARELVAALRTTAARALVLTGDAQSFCAGADLSEIAAVFDNPTDEQLVPELVPLLEDYPAPTIAAIEGHALGGGLELALRCDLRIAGRGARLGLPEVRRGFIPGGIIERTARLIGVARAKELMFTGRAIDADTAAIWGLVSQVTEAGGALAAARTLAAELARGAPLALAEMKRLLRETALMPRDAAYALEMAATGRIAGSADAAEGIAAFLAKRAPRFEGK
jgi:enoyl-CoA hydratase